MKVTSQTRSPTCVTPTFWPANTWLRLTFRPLKQMRPHWLVLPVPIAYCRTREWTYQAGADVAHIKEASSQGEDAPEHRWQAELMIPEDQAYDQERCAGHHTEDVSRRAIEKM